MAFLISFAFKLPEDTEWRGWGEEDMVREAASGWVSTVAQAEEGISTMGFHWFQTPSRVRSTSVSEDGQPSVQCQSLRGVRRQAVLGGGRGSCGRLDACRGTDQITNVLRIMEISHHWRRKL